MCSVRETLQFCSRTVSFDLVVFRSLLARVSDQFFVSSPHEESDNNGEKKLFKDSSSKTSAVIWLFDKIIALKMSVLYML